MMNEARRETGRQTHAAVSWFTDVWHRAHTHNEGEQQQRERHGDTADKGKEINAQLET